MADLTARRAAAHKPAAPATGKPAATKGKAPSGATKTSKKSKPKKVPFKQWWGEQTRKQKAGLIALWAAITIVGLLLLGLVGGILYYETVKLPDPNADYTTATTTLYYRDGTTELGALSVQNRTPLNYDEMPQDMKDAVVAAEDRTFWTNQGVSVTGMVRAALNVARGGSLQSGSTITQQYIKSMYLTSAQTVTRKVKEIVLAMKITNSMSKEQILAGYLNAVYFGRGSYGIQAAAQAYFGIDAADLTVPQAAVLASLLQGPALYDPADASNITRLTQRYDYVLDGMVTMGTLTAADEATYKDNLPDFPPIQTSQTYGGPNGFLIKMVEAELATDGFTSAQIQGGGLQVTTTFDASMQAAAIASAQKFTQTAATKAKNPQDPNLLHAAIASVGVDTGEVMALYGGPDYVTSSWNWATTPRMTGSTFKAFAFIAGERNGWGLDTQLTGDPIKVNGATVYNDGNEQLGQVDLLTATEKSVNTAFVDLVQRIPDGPDQVIQAAEDAGAPAQDDQSWYPGPTIPLGYASVSPLNMAAAYATIANQGTRIAPHVVLEVKDANGSVVYSANPTKDQTIEPDICSDLTYALQSVVDAGTGTAVRSLGYPAAGKTGTAALQGTSGVGAAWFVGFTQQISTAVMYVADPPGSPDLAGTANLNSYAPRGSSTFYGSGYPAQTWADYMKQAMKGLPKVSFPAPAHVNAGAGATPTDQPAPPPPEPTDTPTETLPPPVPTMAPPTTAPPTTHPTTAPPTQQPTTAPPTTQPPTTEPTTAPPTTEPPTTNPPQPTTTG